MESSNPFGQLILGGLTSGLLYALLLLGFMVVFQVSKTVNFAFGQVGMVAAFSAWFFWSSLGLPLPVAIGIGAILAVVVNSAIGIIVITKIPAGRPGLDLVVTLGIFLFLTAVMQLLIDANAHAFPSLGGDKRTVLGGVVVNANDVAIMVLGVFVIGGVYVLFSRTTLGMELRASAENADIAASAGVNVRLLRLGTWTFAGLLAALVAVLVASRLSVDAFYMTPVLIKAFVAGMIGGMDRFFAPLVIAIGIGVYEALAIFIWGSSAGTPAVFLLIIIALAVMPKRFTAARHEVRA
ncbi:MULTISPECIES: branched-chain amino acid ABC transporter permease [unclassified Cryobacterium]|uniref:branched-chain amino acid ABC transporter permease n=1 Tax=unclassified Cryobacterium TaxID=2649013 RepID=UPI00141B096F|nr:MULTISPECIES: branched-chain amino acid ABC transporter permease [unclassified Cryobacterium]